MSQFNVFKTKITGEDEPRKYRLIDSDPNTDLFHRDVSRHHSSKRTIDYGSIKVTRVQRKPSQGDLGYGGTPSRVQFNGHRRRYSRDLIMPPRKELKFDRKCKKEVVMNTTFHAPEVFLIHIGTCNSNRHLHCNDIMVELGNLALGLNDECTKMVVHNLGRKSTICGSNQVNIKIH